MQRMRTIIVPKSARSMHKSPIKIHNDKCESSSLVEENMIHKYENVKNDDHVHKLGLIGRFNNFDFIWFEFEYRP